jgi:hypothetical protein
MPWPLHAKADRPQGLAAWTPGRTSLRQSSLAVEHERKCARVASSILVSLTSSHSITDTPDDGGSIRK